MEIEAFLYTQLLYHVLRTLDWETRLECVAKYVVGHFKLRRMDVRSNRWCCTKFPSIPYYWSCWLSLLGVSNIWKAIGYAPINHDLHWSFLTFQKENARVIPYYLLKQEHNSEWKRAYLS